LGDTLLFPLFSTRSSTKPLPFFLRRCRRVHGVGLQTAKLSRLARSACLPVTTLNSRLLFSSRRPKTLFSSVLCSKSPLFSLPLRRYFSPFFSASAAWRCDFLGPQRPHLHILFLLEGSTPPFSSNCPSTGSAVRLCEKTASFPFFPEPERPRPSFFSRRVKGQNVATLSVPF